MTREHATEEQAQDGATPGGKKPPGRGLLIGCLILFPLGAVFGVLLALVLVPEPEPVLVAPPQPQPAPETEPSPAAERPGKREFLFSASATWPEETPDGLDAGLTQVHCFFNAPDAQPTDDVSFAWLAGTGKREDATATIVLEEGAEHLRGQATLSPPGGAKAFEPDIYEVSLMADGMKITAASFALIDGATQLLNVPKGMERYQPEVKNLVVTSDPPPAKPKAQHLVLPEMPKRLTVTFDYAHAVPGTVMVVCWTYEDGIVAQATTEINIQAETGKGEAWFGAQAPNTLPIGMYSVFVATDQDAPPLARKRVWVGREPRPKEIAPEQ